MTSGFPSGALGAEELYLRLRQVIADMPNLRVERISPELARWFGESSFLVEECGNLPDTVEMRTEISNFGTMSSRAYDLIPIILYRALARAEAKAPSSAHGTFIAAGKPFDALAAVFKLLGEAQSDLLVVDPYAEANLLDDFLRAVPELVSIRILTDEKALKPTFRPAVDAWTKQFGTTRPLAARVAPTKVLHDRLIFLDRTVVWQLGQSFNQLATRSHTSLMKADPELAKMKIDAYDEIWRAAVPL